MILYLRYIYNVFVYRFVFCIIIMYLCIFYLSLLQKEVLPTIQNIVTQLKRFNFNYYSLYSHRIETPYWLIRYFTYKLQPILFKFTI